jgi:hypothetical protein
MPDDALGPFVATFIDMLRPAAPALRDPSSFVLTLRSLDPDLVLPDPTLGGAFGPAGALTRAADVLDDRLASASAAITKLSDDDLAVRVAALADLLEDAIAVTDAVVDAGAVFADLDLDGLGLPPEQQDPGYWAGLFAALPEQLLIGWLEAELPIAYAVLQALGIVDEDERGVRQLHLDRLGPALSDPPGHLRTVTGWAGGALDGAVVSRLAANVASSLGIAERVVAPRPEIADLVGHPQPAAARAVELPLVSGRLPAGAGGGTVELGLILAVVASGGATLDSILVTNLTFGEAGTDIALTDTWSVRSEADVDQTAMVGALFGRDGATTVDRGTRSTVSLTLTGTPDPPWLPVGSDAGTRLEVAGAEVELALSVGAVPELVVRTSLTGVSLVVVAGNGLTRALLGADEVTVPLDLELSWSSVEGVAVGGSVGLEVHVPLDLTVGPITINGLDLGASIDDEGAVTLDAAASLTAVLGPFAVSAEGIGLRAALSAGADGRGTLGPLALDIAALPPSGLGFTIEAPLSSGGGRLALYPEIGRYEGALALQIAAVGIQAMTVIDTVVAGEVGPDTWTFFASLTARFPGIPLGFGFTLTGVGGLVALNRTVDADALALGLRVGAADALLFPDEPVRDAAILFGQLDEYFPPADGNTVIGPVVEIGWGTPTIITGQLGVLISIPQGVVTVLGSVTAVLPTADAPLLELHMDSLGVIDIPGGTVLVMASLYGSRLLGIIELSGDVGLYVSVIEDPYFLLSVGGFHPGFQPPSHVPSALEGLRRMRAGVDVGSGVTAEITAYFAVTSNSVQFGGGFELEASAEFLLTTYTARGWFEFDVLFQFDPFLILADVSAGVGVYAGTKELFGVDLSAHLEGPEPWFATATARFRFFAINVKFDVTVGGHAAGELQETVDVLERIATELTHPEAWSVEHASGAPAGLVLAPEVTDAAIRPDDRVVVRQTVAPFGETLDRLGELTPLQDEVHVASAEVVDVATGDALADVTVLDVTGWFAPAQFRSLPDTARLSSASYELLTAGVSFGADGMAVPSDVLTAPAGHETEVWQPATGVSRHVGVVTTDRLVADLIAGSTVGRAAVGWRGSQVDVERVTVAPTSYAFVDATTGRPVAEGSGRITRTVPAHVAELAVAST